MVVNVPVIMQRRFFTGAVLGQGCRLARCRAQDTAGARVDSTGAVLGLVLHARRCATTGPDGPDSSVWKCRFIDKV